MKSVIDSIRKPNRRQKSKLTSFSYWGGRLWILVRFVLLISISFAIIFPLLVKLSSAFMSSSDLMDKTVLMLPKAPTFDNIIGVIQMTDFWGAARNTFFISLVCAVGQVFVASVVGYALAKFKFRGKSILLGVVFLLMIVPPQTIIISLYMNFRFFDIFGIFGLLSGGDTLNLIDSVVPTFIMAFTGLGIKNGLYIFLMRQFFMGVPNELIEAAYIDGAGVYRTFAKIVIPMSGPTMISILLLSFAWQWTDTLYSSIFFTQTRVLSNSISRVGDTILRYTSQQDLASVYMNTATLLVIAPLLLLYIICQKHFVQGIERSGITG